MALTNTLQFATDRARSRAQRMAAERRAQYNLALLDDQRSRSRRDLDFATRQTDETYLTPFLTRGLGSSGYADVADSRYREAYTNARADIERNFLLGQQNAMLELAAAQQQDELERILASAALAGTNASQLAAQIRVILGGDN